MREVTGKPLREIVQLIRGQEGTTVRLGILPADGSKFTIHQLVRSKYPNVGDWVVEQYGEQGDCLDRLLPRKCLRCPLSHDRSGTRAALLVDRLD